MATIVLDGITKRFPDGTTAVRSLDLSIADGELMVLVGPSGCGKTTALRLVAGLEEVTAGTILIGDRPVNDVEPRDRDIAMVFQSYALYPHLTVRQNMAFSLKYRGGSSKDEIRRRVAEAARVLELEPLLEEEELSARVYHHAQDLESHGRVEVLTDMSRYDAQRLHLLITRHARFTGSTRAAAILGEWSKYCSLFRKVMPLEYRRALAEMEKARTMQAAE